MFEILLFGINIIASWNHDGANVDKFRVSVGQTAGAYPTVVETTPDKRQATIPLPSAVTVPFHISVEACNAWACSRSPDLEVGAKPQAPFSVKVVPTP